MVAESFAECLDERERDLVRVVLYDARRMALLIRLRKEVLGVGELGIESEYWGLGEAMR